MRILHVITLSELGGAQSVVIELSNYMIRRGYEVAVLSKDVGVLWDLLDQRVQQYKAKCFHREINIPGDFNAVATVSKTINDFKPDILHLHSSKAGVWGRLAWGIKKNRIVYTVHGFDSIRKANRLFLPLEKYLSSRCNRIVAVSEYDERNLNSNEILNTCVIPNGIFDPIAEKISDDPFNKSRSKGNFVVLTIARNSPPKRLDLFLESARRMRDVDFYWIGNTEEVQSHEPNVTFLGSIPSAGAMIRFADLFVLFSDYEGMPMSIIEAIASGIPIVASNVGGNPELLRDEVGILVENRVDDIVKAIRNQLSVSEESKRVQKNLRREIYLRNYSVDVMAEKYLEVYEAMIDGKNP